MKYFLPIITVLLLGASMWFWNQNGQMDESSRLRSVEVSEFAEGVSTPDVKLIDIRTAEEFAQGRLAGAENIDFYKTESFRQSLEKLDKNAKYMVYCRSGNRSGQALKIMDELGFRDVMELRGGLVAWQNAGKQVCKNC
jgi:rhodanese-related sulfurtransferase